jgi:hypothetical protein
MMVGLYPVAVVQVGDGAGNAKDLVVGSGGEAHPGHGPLEQIAALAVQDAEPAGPPVRHVGVVARGRALEPLGLPLPGGTTTACSALEVPGVPPDNSRNGTAGTSM